LDLQAFAKIAGIVGCHNSYSVSVFRGEF
jgi:hypothetical protein